MVMAPTAPTAPTVPTIGGTPTTTLPSVEPTNRAVPFEPLSRDDVVKIRLGYQNAERLKIAELARQAEAKTDAQPNEIGGVKIEFLRESEGKKAPAGYSFVRLSSNENSVTALIFNASGNLVVPVEGRNPVDMSARAQRDLGINQYFEKIRDGLVKPSSETKPVGEGGQPKTIAKEGGYPSGSPSTTEIRTAYEARTKSLIKLALDNRNEVETKPDSDGLTYESSVRSAIASNVGILPNRPVESAEANQNDNAYLIVKNEKNRLMEFKIVGGKVTAFGYSDGLQMIENPTDDQIKEALSFLKVVPRRASVTK